MLDLLGNLLSSVVDLVYPPRCPLCDSFVEVRDCACGPCSERVIPLPACANVSLGARVWLSRARSCFAYEGPVRDLIHSFKYSGRLDGVRYLTDRLHSEIASMGGFDLVVPVPMGGGRVVARGLDPCALLARGLARRARMPFGRDVLERVRAVPPQVGLARDEREKNVRGVFAVRAGRRFRIEARRVLVVDDVLTTGATVNDCARALIKAGASEVSALTVARTL